jgi:uncharacterized protein (DUF433 family)
MSVAHIVNLVANGMTPAQIIADLADLEEDIRQALAYSSVLAGVPPQRPSRSTS